MQENANNISNLGMAEDRTLWAKANDSYYRFNGDYWEPETDCSISFPETRVAVKNGETWSFNGYQLIRKTETEMTAYLEGHEILALTFDRNDQLWIAGLVSVGYISISSFDGNMWTCYPVDTNEGHLRALFFDNENTLWAGTEKNGLWSYDGFKWRHYLNDGEYFRVQDCGESMATASRYLPLAVGNTWYYDYYELWYNEERPEKSDKLVMTIVSREEIDGAVNYTFLDGKKLRVDENGSIYKNGVLYCDFTPSENDYTYDFNYSHVRRRPTTVETPIGTCNGYAFNIHFFEHGYTETVVEGLGVIHCQSRSETMADKIYELREAIIDGKHYSSWTTGIEEEQPCELLAIRNHPNPFNPTTMIDFSIPTTSHVKLSVYSGSGQRVATICDEQKAAGKHSVRFDATGLSSGIYLYRIEAGELAETGSMLLVK